jgi:two-component system, chemotaxis family, protein-glutamate methylesterase/glutaminase
MSTPEPIGDRIDAVVIGGSAGAVEALCLILPSVPATIRVPVFIVLHLPRDRPSLLTEVFSHRCACPVREAQDKDPIEPRTVYVGPPDYHLLIEPGLQGGPQISLSVDEVVHFSRPSIDVLFESAADFYRERLLGIILTGANEDGAEGLAAIQRAGGITVVQQPHDAQASFMLRAALSRSPDSLVLSLAEIAELLRTLGDGPTAPSRIE